MSTGNKKIFIVTDTKSIDNIGHKVSRLAISKVLWEEIKGFKGIDEVSNSLEWERICDIEMDKDYQDVDEMGLSETMENQLETLGFVDDEPTWVFFNEVDSGPYITVSFIHGHGTSIKNQLCGFELGEVVQEFEVDDSILYLFMNFDGKWNKDEGTSSSKELEKELNETKVELEKSNSIINKYLNTWHYENEDRYTISMFNSKTGSECSRDGTKDEVEHIDKLKE